MDWDVILNKILPLIKHIQSDQIINLCIIVGVLFITRRIISVIFTSIARALSVYTNIGHYSMSCLEVYRNERRKTQRRKTIRTDLDYDRRKQENRRGKCDLPLPIYLPTEQLRMTIKKHLLLCSICNAFNIDK